MKCRRVRTAIDHVDLNQNVFRRLLRIFDKNVKVAIFIEDARIQQFIFHLPAVPAAICRDQIVVSKLCLRILVQILHV